jgi:hypothetical protein
VERERERRPVFVWNSAASMAIQQPRRWRRGEGEGEEEREREREKRERKRSADSLSSAIETPTEQSHP